MIVRSQLEAHLLGSRDRDDLEAKSPCHPGAPLLAVHLPGEVQLICRVCETPLMEVLVNRRPVPADDGTFVVATCHPANGLIARYTAGFLRFYCYACDDVVVSFRVEEDTD